MPFYTAATLQPRNLEKDGCASCDHPAPQHGTPCRFPYVLCDCGCPEWTEIACAECRQPPGQCQCPSWMP